MKVIVITKALWNKRIQPVDTILEIPDETKGKWFRRLDGAEAASAKVAPQPSAAPAAPEPAKPRQRSQRPSDEAAI